MTHNFSYLLPAFQIINHEIKVLQSFKHKLKDPSLNAAEGTYTIICTNHYSW